MEKRDPSTKRRSTCLVPPFWLIAALLLQWFLHVNLPVARIVDWPLRWAGLGLILFAQGVFFTSSRLFSRNDTTIIPGYESTVLITDGLYRFSRNPIYLAMVLTLAGAAILYGTAGPWLAVAMFFSVMSWHFIAIEEAMLLETFGDAYREYLAGVRRWL